MAYLRVTSFHLKRMISKFGSTVGAGDNSIKIYQVILNIKIDGSKGIFKGEIIFYMI